jgi:hypothetical protein
MRPIFWCGIMDWGREPYGGASHAWRPEREYWNVLAELGDMKLGSKSEGPHLHVCGEVYSDYHAFIEGALRSAVYVLARISNLNDTSAKVQATMTTALGVSVPSAPPPSSPAAVGANQELSRDDQYFEDLITWIDKLDARRPKQ